MNEIPPKSCGISDEKSPEAPGFAPWAHSEAARHATIRAEDI
jgi:hypothetical protein